MCTTNFSLGLFLFLKIIFLVIIPISLIILYKLNNRFYKYIGILECIVLILFIILKIFNTSCFKNSTFTYFSEQKSNKVKLIENNSDKSSSVYSLKVLENNVKPSYVYNINASPLNNIKINCDKKSYMNTYGKGITAITMLMSNTFESEFNEIDIINALEKNKLIDCEKGIDFDKSINTLAKQYSFKVYKINSSEIDKYLFEGKNVLAETINNSNDDNNFGCSKDYIIIYDINNDSNYSIINPNDKDYSYFCPSNTKGYGSIIEGNQNDHTYSFNDINSKASRYFVIEVE